MNGGFGKDHFYRKGNSPNCARQSLANTLSAPRGAANILLSSRSPLQSRYSEDAMGGWKKEGGAFPKRGFGPPLVRYVFHPSQVSVLFFSCTKIHDRADQKLLWRGPRIFGRARSLVRFPPPIRVAPPHITAQVASCLFTPCLNVSIETRFL